jgi:hypothetical protein
MPEEEKESPDYPKDSAADRAEDAPSGKEAVTEEDAELAEDQSAFQTDSS